MMKSDRVISTYSFNHSFKVIIPKKEAWLNSEKLPWPSDSSVVYTDGSHSTGKTGAGVYIESLGHTESVPLGTHASIFLAEVYAVMHSAQILEQFGVNNEQISICSDSQAASKALSNPRITSRLVWDCIVALQQLSIHNAVRLFWVPGHSGIYGNEQADQLAKAASFKRYAGPEPVLPVPTSVVQSRLQGWTLRETQTRWQDLKSCRQAKETIDVAKQKGR